MMNQLCFQASQAIESQRQKITAATTNREFLLHPELEQRYGTIAREKSLQDADFHLSFLVESMAAENLALFSDYIEWSKIVLMKRGILSEDLAFHLDCMKETLRDHLPAELFAVAAEFIDVSLRQLPDMPEDIPTFMEKGLPLASLSKQFLQALLQGKRRAASQLIMEAADGGIPIKDIDLHVFQRSQYEIGRLWQTNRINVAQEHYCSAATQLIMSLLYPRIFSSEKCAGTLVATCVSGDLHEIGARMVADFFEMDGWDSYYLGANTPTPAILEVLHERKPDLLAISANILYHVNSVRALISRIRGTPDLAALKVIVGGRPFNVDTGLWEKIGADGSVSDVQKATILATELLSKAPAA
jgi:methanogenic corrinoid protein MtbC1